MLRIYPALQTGQVQSQGGAGLRSRILPTSLPSQALNADSGLSSTTSTTNCLLPHMSARGPGAQEPEVLVSPVGRAQQLWPVPTLQTPEHSVGIRGVKAVWASALRDQASHIQLGPKELLLWPPQKTFHCASEGACGF